MSAVDKETRKKSKKLGGCSEESSVSVVAFF
jgi:hypothetical protein